MKQTRKRICRASIASLFCATVLASTLPALPASAATAALVGDVTLDGNVNLSDVVAAQQYLLNKRTLSAEAGANADYNADNVCNVIDLILLKRDVLNKIDPVNDAITIHLSDSGITVENDTNGVTSISGKTVTITASGNYKVDGSIADGQILINIPDTTADANDVELFLNNVTMTSSTGEPCIYTQSAVKTKLTVSGTNTFTDTAATANAVTSGVIYADGKLTVTKNSTGILDITSSMNVGLYSTKNMNLNGGTIRVNTDVDDLSDADAIKTKNTLTVEGAAVEVDASADGLKSTKEEVDVISGSVTVKSGNDAVQAATAINISGGTVIAGGDRGFRLDDGGALNITGGDVLATATDYQFTESTESVDLSTSTQGIMMLDFAAEQSKKQSITVQQNGTTVYEMTTNKKCSYALLSGSGIAGDGVYTVAVNGTGYRYTAAPGSTTPATSFVMEGNATEFYNVEPDRTTTDSDLATISFSGNGVQLLNASGSDVTNNVEGVTVNGSTVTITVPGSFEVTGESSNARIEVNVDKTTYAAGVVELLLKDVSLSNSAMAPIYVESIGDEVVLNSVSGTVNTISDGTSHTDTYVDSDGVTNTVNGAVFSRDDLKLKGSGSLTINGNTEDGLVCKNDLKLYNGTITVTAKDDAIRGNDSIVIGNDTATDYSNLKITATSTAGDGFKTNDTDTTSGKGFITVNGGTVEVTSYSDGFHASQALNINGGEIQIKTTCPASQSSSGNWGGWQPGGSTSTTTDVSAKGLKAGCTDDNSNTIEGTITIAGGTITIDSTDDSVHATNITMTGGNVTAASGDDGMHADTKLDIQDGTVNITKSYEGLEAADLQINGGNIHVNASDDGLNAAGGNDGSGSGSTGGWGQGSWGGGMSSSTGTLTISDGYLVVRAEGDGLDSNGNLTISGGTVQVYGPTTGGNGIFDKGDGNYTFSITGGTIWGCGTSDMFESPNTSYLSGTVSATAGATFAAADSSGNVSSTITVPSDMNMSNAMLFYYGSDVSSVSLYSGGTYSGTRNEDGYGTGGTLSGGSAVSSSSSGGGNTRPW
ncbi:MAG: carbohydrate-binding domain-containing protein [Oscillospiraceae bacterium]|nr:carbohydrate-binding domain-containing protein [Oscillospiraceae bacterium]